MRRILITVKQAHEPNSTGKKGKVNNWSWWLDNRIHKGAHAGTRRRGKDLTVNRSRAQDCWERATTNLTTSVGALALVTSGNGVISAISLTILYQTTTPYHETLS